MYLLRGVVVSLGVFFLTYVGLSTLLIFAWGMLSRKSSELCAGILYGMRVLPLIGAFLAVGFFTLPSFLYLEPRVAQERIGIAALTLATSGAAVLLVGFLNCVSAWLNTSRLITSCLKCSRRLETATGMPVFQILSDSPLIFVAGLWSPKVLVSTGVLTLLEPDEIGAAIRHEIAHVDLRDNIKKMVLRFCPFPLLRSLECEWLRAAETAADDAATGNEETALSLASALVKMAGASDRMNTPELAMTLLPQNGVSLRVRVASLLSERQSHQRNGRVVWYTLLVSAALFTTINYLWFLTKTHALTEFLIR